MANSHGDGGPGSSDGTMGDRAQTRSRKREKSSWCLLCIKSGRKSRLQLFQIGPSEAMYLCPEETCPFPVSMTDDVHGSVVSRELSELKILSPQRGGSEKSKPLKNFPTSMPIVVPVESQKIPTITKEDLSLKRTLSLASEPLEFRLWRENKRHFRINSLPHEENLGGGKNGEVRERGDGMVTKRPRVRSRQAEFEPDTDANKVKLISYPNKLPGHKPRLTMTSIRKIDKTLMQASGVDFNKKFAPFTITPQEKVSKESISKSPEPESDSENKDTEANNEIATTQEYSTPNAAQTDTQENSVQSNGKLVESPHDAILTNHIDEEDPMGLQSPILPVDSIQMPLGHQDQWHHPPTQQGNGMPLQNGDISNSIFITPPQYLHNNYRMMPPHPHYNSLIPPPTGYHTMPPTLHSPLPPPPDTYSSQFYYQDSMYPYSEQWDDNQAELELTKMLDSLDMPPTDQYDPTIGMLPAGSPTEGDMYDLNLMDPTTPNLTGPYERPHPIMQIGIDSISSPPLNNSMPMSASEIPNQMGTQISDSATFKELPSAMPTSGHATAASTINGVATFNNTEESPTSSYHSPQSEGEYQSVSLVRSAS